MVPLVIYHTHLYYIVYIQVCFVNYLFYFMTNGISIFKVQPNKNLFHNLLSHFIVKLFQAFLTTNKEVLFIAINFLFG